MWLCRNAGVKFFFMPLLLDIKDINFYPCRYVSNLIFAHRPTDREGGGVSHPRAHELQLRVQTNKQVESCFLNQNSSIHFCCTDSLLMTHRGGLSLIIIIWRIGGGGKFPFALGTKNSLGGPDHMF